MTKGNPLFVDSTKLQSDTIGTQIELQNIFLREGEEVFVKITNNKGQVHRAKLKYLAEDFLCHGQVWLNHQQKMMAQFYIEKDGQILYNSDIFSSRATYMLQFDWQACFEFVKKVKPRDKFSKPKTNQSKKTIPSNLKSRFSINESVSKGVERVGDMMSKWGF